jgi:hypothetical protein
MGIQTHFDIDCLHSLRQTNVSCVTLHTLITFRNTWCFFLSFLSWPNSGTWKFKSCKPFSFYLRNWMHALTSPQLDLARRKHQWFSKVGISLCHLHNFAGETSVMLRKGEKKKKYLIIRQTFWCIASRKFWEELREYVMLSLLWTVTFYRCHSKCKIDVISILKKLSYYEGILIFAANGGETPFNTPPASSLVKSRQYPLDRKLSGLESQIEAMAKR